MGRKIAKFFRPLMGVVLGAGILAAAASPARAAEGWSGTLDHLHDALDASEKGLDRISFGSMAADLNHLLTLAETHEGEPLEDVRFADLYRLAMAAKAAGRDGGATERYLDALRRLDLEQYRDNDALARPSTRWIRAFARKQGVPDSEVDAGLIEHASRKICVDGDGDEQPMGTAGCRPLTYDRFDFRIPDVAPERVLAWIDEVPASVINDRIREAFEVDLGDGRIFRSHKTIDFYLSSGYMELYRVRERVAADEVIVREENARTGKFVKRSDGIVRIRSDGRGGSYYLIVGTADTVFGDDFLADKRTQETIRSLAILRQYVSLRADGVAPGQAAREARERGLREWRDVQLAAASRDSAGL
ncbi:MAG: hypothetical protein KC466_01515 [Myxococcales bacterium]|nr:hypothetical protein [Myxococcales bacterium]